eukprot:2235381-Lingulodinium_polyedra.AAC.1
MKGLLSVGLDLQSLSQRFKVVVVGFGMAGASTNNLMASFVDSRLEPNIMPMQSPCFLHASNRLAFDHIKSKFDVLNPVHSILLLLHLGANYEDFCA